MKRKKTVLSIQVSRENENGPIVAEQIFSTLSSIQTNEKISFEIANIDGKIRFYVWMPSKFENLIESQIYAQYPDVEIFEERDYALKKFPKKLNHVIGAELTLSQPDVYPIKRYVQFEDKITRVAIDPLAGITASLAKLTDKSENACIQIVIRPLADKWRITFVKAVRLVGKGIYANIETLQSLYLKMYCTRKKRYRIIFFPLYIIFWFQGLTAGISKMSPSFLIGDESSQKNSSNYREELSKSHERETITGAALDKVSKILFEVNIRMLFSSEKLSEEERNIKIREIAGSFHQFNIPQLNGLKIKKIQQDGKIVDAFKRRDLHDGIILNNEELATLYHLPNITVTTPNIDWVRARKLEPPHDLPTPDHDANITILGKTNYRGIHKEFGIALDDRRRHVYIIGKTGMGKSTLLENMLYSDICAGKGVAIIDPHGDTANAVMNFIPSNRTNDVVMFDPADRDFPVAFNMLENIDSSLNSIVCSGLIGIFKKIYGESWGPRLEHFLRNTILALLEYENSTMLGIPRMLQDENFRKKVIKKITDPIVKSFWENEFGRLNEKQRTESISPILNKVGQFLSTPLIRNIVGQPKSAIDLRFVMDKGKIFIANLAKGKIGEDSSALLGAMLITKFQIDAMSRADIKQEERKDYYLYVDEFQNFATDSFATILSEARKYRLNLTMANQYIAQMSEEVQGAVFGNVGTIISFQVGFDDAEYLAGQFAEEECVNDLISLNKFTAYSRLLINGMPSRTFSLDTLPPPQVTTDKNTVERILKVSHERYSHKRAIVEDKIRRWHENKK